MTLLGEGLEDELGSDVEFSQRGVLNLAHDLGVDQSDADRFVERKLARRIVETWI